MSERIQGTSILKWNMTVNIITRFLETLSDEDAVQIVGLKREPEVLMGPNVMRSATKKTVEQLTKRLRKQRSDRDNSVVDIGKAISRAMDLLYANEGPESAKCENVPPPVCLL